MPELPYFLFYFERFPRVLLSGHPIQRQAWHTPFLKDIAENGIHTPLVVWGHEDSRFSVMRGNNRLWAAEQLGIEQVPVVVSSRQMEQGAGGTLEGSIGCPMAPGGCLVSSLEQLQTYFSEGKVYANKRGWGVNDVAIPESTYRPLV